MTDNNQINILKLENMMSTDLNIKKKKGRDSYTEMGKLGKGSSTATVHLAKCNEDSIQYVIKKFNLKKINSDDLE